ncbi:hypothetical protein BDY19DRAFT_940589, partial [Irpex rosettiformis]
TALLGTAETTEVYGTRCVARTKQKTALDVKRCTAIALDEPQKLSYVIELKDPSPSRDIANYRRTLSQTTSGRSLSRNVFEVDDKKNAELRLCFEVDRSLTLYRLDPLLSTLPNPPPRLTAKEVEQADFGEILSGIARFNKLLALNNVTSRPFADQVTFQMYRLTRPSDSNSYSSHESGFILRETDKLVQTTAYGHEVQEDEEYAMLLHNHTMESLFVQIRYFDPDTYEIVDAYQPITNIQPNLPANGSLQIGASTEWHEPLGFFLPRSATRATLFAKVFLADSFTKLDLLYQQALVGVDWSGKSNVISRESGAGDYGRADDKADVQTVGRWDTVLQRITVVRSGG